MARSGRESLLWFFLEPVVTIVVALVLYFPLNKKDLAELTAIFGALLVVANIAQTFRLRREFETVAKLGEIIDLSQEATVADIRELLRLYVAIKEPELTSLKDDAVETCTAVLAKLAYDKVSAEIGAGEYHIWLSEMLSSSAKNSTVRAVSTMIEAEWISSPAEKKFLEANIAAGERGMKIERIFVTTRERFQEQANQAVIAQHLTKSPNGLCAYVVWQEDLKKHDPGLLRDIGCGFIAFDDRVALVDVAVPPGEAKGVVTMSAPQLKSLRRLFERLMLHAHTANPELLTSVGEGHG